MDKITPHMWAAIALLLIALVLGLGKVLSGASYLPIEEENLTMQVGPREISIVDSNEALGPVVESMTDRRPYNPFSLEVELATRDLSRFPVPPPPPLSRPQPLPLPLPSEGQP